MIQLNEKREPIAEQPSTTTRQHQTDEKQRKSVTVTNKNLENRASFEYETISIEIDKNEMCLLSFYSTTYNSSSASTHNISAPSCIWMPCLEVVDLDFAVLLQEYIIFPTQEDDSVLQVSFLQRLTGIYQIYAMIC